MTDVSALVPVGYDVITKTVAASKILKENGSKGCGVSLFVCILFSSEYKLAPS